MKKIFAIVGMVAILTVLSENVGSQGPCRDVGIETIIGGTVVFICPVGGGDRACAYPCGRGDE